MPRKKDIKKISLLGLASLFLFSLVANALIIWTSPAVQAQTNHVSVPDIEGLTGLSLDFGASQNSLVLTLEGEADRQVVFGLARTTSIPRPGRALHRRYHLEYEANLPAFPGYGLATGESKPSHCSIRPSIVLDSVEYIKPSDLSSVDGYQPTWQLYDFSNKDVVARITLPLLNEATASIGDDCLLLETELDFESNSGVPLWALAGERLNATTCSGLKLYGRGGDNLENAGVTWFCYDDFDAALAGDARDKFAQIETPPFNRSYIFIERRTDQCGGRLLVDADEVDSGLTTLAAEWQDWHDDCSNGQFDKDENQKKVSSFLLVNALRQPAGDDDTADSQTPVSTAADIGDSNLPAGAGTVDESCEFHLSGLGFGYLACWLAELISGGLNWLESAAKDNLRLDRSDYTQTFPDGGGEFTYKDAWANIRNFMTFAVVGTALFMVISTALDVGFFSNYTVKKYLPRLIIGTILIQFSWALGDLFIQLTNQLGDFMESILYAAVPGARGHDLADIFGGGNFASFFVGGVGVATAIYAILLPVGFTAISFLFIGWLFLVARKYMLIMLLILGPLGLALWVLPGSDRAWRFYAKTFFYLLLFYPVVVTTIAAGKIFSYLILL